MKVGIVGLGRLGWALATVLSEKGYRPSAVVRSTPAASKGRLPAEPISLWPSFSSLMQCDLVVLCVRDREIEPVAARLCEALLTGPGMTSVVLHTSGLLDSSVLSVCREASAAVGSWHPLMTFPPPGSGSRSVASLFEGVWVAVEGDEEAVRVGNLLAKLVGAVPWTIRPEEKPVYHAAASVASNLVQIVLLEALSVLEERTSLGRRAVEAMAPLVRQAVENILAGGRFEVVTGPVVRGDAYVVNQHLRVLPKHVAAVYAELARIIRTRLGGGLWGEEKL